MRRLTIATVLLTAVGAIAYSFSSIEVWSGQFVLTAKLNIDSNVDLDSVKYRECWEEELAIWLRDNVDEKASEFDRPTKSNGGTDEILVSCGGKKGMLGFVDTYHHPRFIVVQYEIFYSQDGIQRKILELPVGRGNREISLSLP